MMDNRSNDFESFLSKADQREIQIEERLNIQIKPAVHWLKHINYLCNEVDDTISVILSPDKEQSNLNLYHRFSKLSAELPSSNKSLSSEPVCRSLPTTIAQFQELSSKAQKEIHKLKSQIQKDAPAANLKHPYQFHD
jgi:hypothetical protein